MKKLSLLPEKKKRKKFISSVSGSKINYIFGPFNFEPSPDKLFDIFLFFFAEHAQCLFRQIVNVKYFDWLGRVWKYEQKGHRLLLALQRRLLAAAGISLLLVRRFIVLVCRC